jgi:cbb3-type cytochrome oxidase subunit 1
LIWIKAHGRVSAWRLRPVHTMRRHLRLRRQRADRDVVPRHAAHVARALPDQFSPWFVLLGYNLFCVIAVSGYLMGITQSKEYAEPEWYADIWLVVVWVVYFVLYCARWPGAKNRISTSRTGTTWPSSWSWRSCTSSTTWQCRSRSATKSYSLFSGVQDAMTQWWYGHNAVAFFLTAGFLGMMYYFCRSAPGGRSFLSAVDHQLLGHHLLLHVGGLAPPALHGAAALGADAGHDLLGDAAGAVMGLRPAMRCSR